MRDFQRPGRSTVHAGNAMVATSHPIAAFEALTILREGGSAADAAIAAAVALGACEPQMCGLGGDCFVLVSPPGGNSVEALNGSGRAPAKLDAERLRGEGLEVIPVGHPASVTMPGAVDALCRLSERHGRLGLERLFAPAIRLFEEGVPVAPRVATDWRGATLSGDAARHYLPNGRAPRVGDVFALPAQAEVLRRIARDGAKAFYEGEVAADMIAALAAAGGVHDEEDFAAVRSDWGEPVRGGVGKRTLVEHPPNGQGAAAILLARILAHHDAAGLDPNGADRHHLLAEATKLAYDARNRFIADPAHTTRLDHILSEETAERLARLIDPHRVLPTPPAPAEAVHRDTVLVTAVDRDGMAVSLIYSIFATFGSGIASPKFGILFHNRGSGFSLAAGHPNEAGPRKRPLHTIIPAMTERDGRVDMAFGVMGGQYQATGHATVLSNLDVFGMDLQEALDAPRSFAEPGGRLQVERGLPEATRRELAGLGHDVVVPDSPLGGAQAIAIDHETGTLTGASDPRKDGCALGY